MNSADSAIHFVDNSGTILSRVQNASGAYVSADQFVPERLGLESSLTPTYRQRSRLCHHRPQCAHRVTIFHCNRRLPHLRLLIRPSSCRGCIIRQRSTSVLLLPPKTKCRHVRSAIMSKRGSCAHAVSARCNCSPVMCGFLMPHVSMRPQVNSHSPSLPHVS
ncbi:hypothetical protein BC826DRAFT_993587 [Russula brevipes]|nr:hypothetical protein BC826DRAFT_993587 [Russula brevipes]